jgi:acyl-CoA synthetase (AMP-forming)/AMP-acid ligase II
LCVRKIKPEQLANLDLSSWEVAFNGAEPIDYKSLERFAKTFEPCGFRPSAFYPCYGMAEATLIVSGGAKNENMVVKTVSKEGLEQNRAISVNPEVDNARILVSCGKKLPDQQIAIVNPKTLTKCQPREIGEIWLAGPSIAQGYWCKPEATKNTFRAYLKDTGEGPFLRTGDLGFIEDEELFVTGRSKDIIIINGRNHYPQDIERTIEQSHPWLRPSCSAAFAVNIGGEEKLVAIAEIDRRYLDPQQQKSQDLIQLIRKAVFQNHDLHLHSTILLKPGSIPKTSSGKIQRHACRTGFLENSLNVVQKH